MIFSLLLVPGNTDFLVLPLSSNLREGFLDLAITRFSSFSLGWGIVWFPFLNKWKAFIPLDQVNQLKGKKRNFFQYF